MKKYNSYNSQIFKITFTGIMLSFALLFSVLQKFFPFGAFLKFDFSLIFVTAALFVVGWRYTFALIVARFFTAPLFNESGYSYLGLLGQLAVFLVAICYITTLYVSFRFLPIKNNYLRLTFSLILATIITIIIINIVNLFLINSLYFTLFNNGKFVSIFDIQKNWEGYKALFFFLPNYYVASIALYTAFNSILLSITSIISFITYRVVHKL